MTKGRKKSGAERAAMAAKRLPTHMQDIAFSKAKKHRPNLGTFGAASPVRRIDPKTGDVIGRDNEPI